DRDLGRIDGSWRLYRVTEDDAPERTRPIPTPAARLGVFRREGEVWLLSLDTVAVRLRDRKGLADIARLLSRPYTEVHVAELVDAGELGPRPTADARLDDSAIAAYRARIDDLRCEEDEARAAND